MSGMLAMVSTDLLWRNALGAIPLMIAVAIICRCSRCRPSTRHALWLIVLASLLAPPLLPALDFSDDVRAQQFFANLSQRGQLRASAPTSPAASLEEAVASLALRAPVASQQSNDPVPPTTLGRPASRPHPLPEHREVEHHGKPTLLALPVVPPAITTPTDARNIRDEGIQQDTLIAAQPVVAAADASSGLEPTTLHAPLIEWRQWLVRVAAARDALVMLAPIPGSLWLAGAAVIVLVMAGRAWRFTRLVNNAEDADAYTVAMVKRCSEAIGLATQPQVMMTHRAVSPLVWCGTRRVLLLPCELWRELDDAGRCAVLVHELAHLRRRDHWWCWVEMIVCAVYWWNPLAWWARSRLRDEADYCCDAWVTAVLPESRTAYARALLATRAYLSSHSSRVEPPTMALGATSARTKRFARRLTMVMTERTTPRLSLTGTAAALMLAGAAWVATPLWACPPEDSADAKAIAAKAKAASVASAGVKSESSAKGHAAAKSDATAQAEAKAAKDRDAKAAASAETREAMEREAIRVYTSAVAPKVVVPATAGSTYEEHMARRDASAPAQRSDDGLGVRIDRLEQRMDRLAEQLERLLNARSGAAASPAPPSSPPQPLPPPASPSVRAMPAAPPAPPAPPAAGQGRIAAVAPSAPAVSSEVIVRFYSLPRDKAKALFEFMKRSDVPVMVAPRDEGIEVHGTAEQHRVFSAFMKMVHPEAKIEAKLIESDASSLARERTLIGERMRAEAMQQARLEREAIARQRERQVNELRLAAEQRQREMEAQRREMEQRRLELERQLQELHRKSEELRRESQTLRRRSQEIQDLGQRQHLEAQAGMMEQQADALRSQAVQIEGRARVEFKQIETQLAAHAKEFESMLERRAQEMEKAFEAMALQLEQALPKSHECDSVAPPPQPKP